MARDAVTWLRWIAVAGFLALTACAQMERVRYDPSNRIRKIALLAVNEPAPQVVNEGGVATFLGMAGGLVQAGIDVSNSARLQQAFNERRIRIGAQLAAALRDELRARRYEVEYLEGQRARLAADGKGLDYSGITTDADAILNVWYGTVGYLSPALSTDYHPWINVGARMVDARTKQVLYYRIFTGGWSGATAGNVENVGFDEKYKFGSVDALIARVDQSAEGIVETQRRVAARIAQHLR